MSTKIVWGYAKDVEELNCYFPDYNESELPERNYLRTIISSIMPSETKELIQTARNQRGVNKKDEKEMVAITKEIKKEIFEVSAQKSKIRFLFFL